MMIFQYSDYRSYLKDYFRSQGGGGRGQMQKLAALLGVHSTFVSLVFKNKRELSVEQAVVIAQHMNLVESEADYFLNLIQHERAGNQQLRTYFKQKLVRAQEAAKRLENRFDHDRKLAAEERQVFYSSWHYSAIRIFTSTNETGRTLEEICDHFKLSRAIVVEALEFLTTTQLVIEEKARYKVGPQRTFLERGHPLLKCHHTNWRLKALNHYEELSSDEMMFTSTLSLSRSDFGILREHLASLVKTSSDIMRETKPEDVACLNIDFFWVK